MRPGKASRERRLSLQTATRRVGGGQALDEIDLKIMEALRANGRESFRRIAGELGISEATVRGRFARLERMQLFQVRGVVNALAVGFDAAAMVRVKTSGPPIAVAQQLTVWPEVTSVVVVAGEFDLVVEVVCQDRHELLEVLNRMRGMEGVGETDLSPYLQICKHPQEWEPELPAMPPPRVRTARRGS